jgi:hypothetical protein
MTLSALCLSLGFFFKQSRGDIVDVRLTSDSSVSMIHPRGKYSIAFQIPNVFAGHIPPAPGPTTLQRDVGLDVWRLSCLCDPKSAERTTTLWQLRELSAGDK